MKKKIILPVLLLISFVILFASCTPATINIDKVKKFPVYGNYRIAGGGAVTKGKEMKLIDDDIILPAIKKSGHKVNVGAESYSHGNYYGDYYFFNYKYYSKRVDENNYPSPYRVAYAFGYVNLVTLNTTILKTVERTEPEYYSSGHIYRTGLIFKDGYVSFVDYDGYIGSINARTLEYKSYEFDCVYPKEDNCVLRDIYGEWMLYDRLTDNINREYYAINYITKELADGETLAVMTKMYEEEKKTADGDEKISLPYDGKNYICEISDEKLAFTAQDNGFEITMDEMREKSEEVRKVEEMGEVKITFKSVVAGNGEIYFCCAHFNDGMFGMNFYSDATATLCFVYKPETDELRYIGWLRGNSVMQSVVKL